jgi:hypothetical protein
MKKYFIALLLALAPFLLAGCVGDLIELSCLFMEDRDHCYQAAAIQKADPYGCEKVSGKDFKGSNPPRDKCYLLIAENTGDYGPCEFIKGGPLSYTKEECIMSVAVGTDDPAGCKKLSGQDLSSCREQVSASITSDKLKDISAEVEALKSSVGSNPDDQGAKKRLAELKAKQDAMFEFAGDAVKGQYFKEAREEIMSDIEDVDVQSEISKIFIDFRGKNPNLSLNDQIKKLEEIKEEQDRIKNLDEISNTLMDQLKESVGDFADDTIDDLYGDDIEKYKQAMQERGIKYLEENGGKSIKNGIAQLEWIKEKYDKASEQYEAITEQIDKLKKVYDEVSEVYRKVDEINKLVAEGRLDAGKAKVLHGAVFLGKGLEYATEYVPVFGSTISTISKETFNATIEFAKKRAQRTTAIDKCIEDPEHCDTDGISAY